MSIELQPCLGMSWYDFDLNVERVCSNKARIYSIKQCLSLCEHDFHTIVVRFQVRFSTVCYGRVRITRINWTFTGFTNGPTDFCSSSILYDLYTILTRLSQLVEWTSCADYTVSYGLTRVSPVSITTMSFIVHHNDMASSIGQ